MADGTDAAAATNGPAAPAPRRATGASDMAPRLVSGAAIVLVLVAVCLWGAAPFAVLMAALALIGRAELTRAYLSRGIRPNALLSLAGALLPVAVLFLPAWRAWTLREPMLSSPLFLACLVLAAGIWETALAMTATDVRAVHVGRNLAVGLLCGAYLSLFSTLALLRLTPWQQGARPALLPVEGGAGLVLVTLLSTMAGDAAAYLAGRARGRHKMAPVLSPGKTTEGLAAGVVTSVALGALGGWALLGSTAFGLAVGLEAGLLGPAGDLFKSALKREIGIKDFGTLIPGHGGVLDRFDSVLVTSPVALLLAKTIGPWLSRMG